MPIVAPVGAVYGKAKIGKSSQLAELIAGGGMCIVPSKTALLPAITYLGLKEGDIKQVVANNIGEVRKIVKEWGPKVPIMAIDDLSVIVRRSGKDWKTLNQNIIGLVFEDCVPIRDKNNTAFMFTLHEQEERMTTNKRIRGGPELPGQAPEEFSGYMDLVMRAVYDDTMKPWPAVYWSTLRGNWIAGDRLSVFPDCCPMNLAEGLRMYGMDIKRPAGLDWMNGYVKTLAERIGALDNITDWRKPAGEMGRQALEKDPSKFTAPLIKWASRDALHRAIYIKAASIDTFFTVPDDVIIA